MLRYLVIVVVGILVPLGSTEAAIVSYNDRTQWEWVIGELTQVTEDFEGFSDDTEFRSALIELSIGQIGQFGDDQAFRNFVDTPSFLFDDNNGSNHASMWVDGADGFTAGTTVELIFAAPVAGWGADFLVGPVFEMFSVDLVSPAGLVLATLGPNQNDGFLGFFADGGEEIAKLLFRATAPGGVEGGEGFSMDNATIAFSAPVPVPAGLWLLLSALLVTTTRQRAESPHS